MPSSPVHSGAFTAEASSSSPRGRSGHGETSPLLPRSASGSALACERGSPRGASRGISTSSTSTSHGTATTAAASSLSVNNSSNGGPGFGESVSSGGGRSRDARSHDDAAVSEAHTVNGGHASSIFGTSPASLSGFFAVLAHSIALQSWTSYVLATMAKSLLEAQGVIKAKSRDSTGDDGNGLLLPSSVSQAPVSVESVWAIHDALFFLEEGHVVMPTSIANSFGSLRHKKPKKNDGKSKKSNKGGSSSKQPGSKGSGSTSGNNNDAADGGEGADGDANNADNNNGDGNASGGKGKGDGKKDGDETHTYIVPHGTSGGADADLKGAKAMKVDFLKYGAAAIVLETNDRKTLDMQETRTSKAADTSVRRSTRTPSDTQGAATSQPLFNFAAPPPVAPQAPMSQRKSATHGQATLSKIIEAWEASPLYSSPLALTLFYYLYSMGCILLLLTVTDGMLTGHFSVLRLCVSLAELLWYVHHGAHAFVIYGWLLLLSHWPRGAWKSKVDEPFLHSGTPFAVVSKTTGAVKMYWFYRAPFSGKGYSEGQILQSEVDMAYYLYDQVWYLKPVASGIAVVYLLLLSFCLTRDLHRMLDAVVGVRVLMEPEGCVRCPLCGELMEVCQQPGFSRRKSVYQSARDGTSFSVRRTMWWWRWLRSAVRGSSSGHRVPTPRLPSPLWRWLLPGLFGGGPKDVDAEPAVTDCDAIHNGGGGGGRLSAENAENDDAPYAVEDMLEDVEFYEQSAVRRSAAAPQDTITEETAHLMRWLTVVPKSESAVVVPVKGERSGSDSATGDEAADALGIGSSGSESSEEEAGPGLVRVVPAGTGSTACLTSKGSAGSLPAAKASSPAKSPRGSKQQCHRGSSSVRRRRHSHALSPESRGSSQQLTKPKRVTRFTEEVLYWNYATRHVHHRCPKLYLDAPEATDDEDDDTDSDADDGSESTDSSTSEASSSADSAILATGSPASAAGTAAGGGSAVGVGKEMRVSGTLVAATATAATRAHAADANAANAARVSQRGLRRSLSPRVTTAARKDPNVKNTTGSLAASSAYESPDPPGEKHRLLRKYGYGNNKQSSKGGSGNNGGDGGGGARNYGTMNKNISEGPSQLFANGASPQAAANHIVQRGVYDPTKDEEDEFRPGNAFQSFDRAGWLSRLTYSWLNPLLTFGLLEPTLLRQERFLPALPEQLLSLDNLAVPAWRLWLHRKAWYAGYVAKPGELLIPSNEAMDRAEEQVMSLADMYEVELSDDDGDETESSEGHQTVVMLGHTSLKQAAKFRPQRPRRSWEERLFWALTAPVRYVLVNVFYYTYIGTSRTVQRTRRRLVRELLKDRLVAAAEDMYDENGYQAMEANEAIEEATWALAEMASSCGSSAAAPSAGSALPTHMRRQLALSDVSLFHIFMEHRCGRRFALLATPLLLLSEALTLALVPLLALFVRYLQKVDTIEILPGRRGASSEEENVTTALLLAASIGCLLLVQGVVQSAYVSQVQEAAMETRTCVRAMVLEKTLALPLAQRTFCENEVVTLATEEASRVAVCLLSLHQTWAAPLRVGLLSVLLGYYLGWAAAAVAGVGPLAVIPWLRHASHEVRQSRHAAQEATKPRHSLLQLMLDHIREVKGTLLEGRLMRRFRRAREREAALAEGVAMAEGTSMMLLGGVTGLLMVAALGAECLFSEKALRDMDILLPAVVIFVLMTTPLLELPALFTVVARGFLSMKRIEAYLRQTPDEFVGTWVDLTTFTAMQQQLRAEKPNSALLHYRRGSVVCRDSSFTWQHDLTEEAPMTLLRDVDVCIEPGQLVVVQGSIGTGKSTLLLSILGEVNRCVTAGGAASGDGGSYTGYDSESSLSVVSASEEAAVMAAAANLPPLAPTTAAPPAARPSLERASNSTRRGSTHILSPNNNTGSTSVFPTGSGSSGALDAAAMTGQGIFVASPTDSEHGSRRRRVSKDVEASAAGARKAAVWTSGNASETGDAASSAGKRTDGSQPHPAGLDDEGSSTGGFLVFGSCAYCAEVPWLQNDTIRANIMSSGGPIQMERWYDTVLRACALNAEIAALPQGDATVVGERGELLPLSMRCRIAIARAVYSKSHVYLLDSVLSPLEPLIQEHIIREVFHKLLRKRTVILASNVGLRSLRPHRVFSLVEGGVVREDTDLYKAVSSLNARSDEDEDDEVEGGDSAEAEKGQRGDAKAAVGSVHSSSTGGSHNRHSSRSARSSRSSDYSQSTAAPLPPLYAEEFEEPCEESEPAISEDFEYDPAAAAAALLFDGGESFALRDTLYPELSDRHDGVLGGSGADVPMSSSFYYGGAAGATSNTNSGSLRLRRSVRFSPQTPARLDSQHTQRSLASSGQALLQPVTLPPPMVPLAETAAAQVASATGLENIPSASLRASLSMSGQKQHQQPSRAPEAGRTSTRSETDTTTSDVSTSHPSGFSTEQNIKNHFAQQLERERMLRHRHRLSFFIFLRFMGSQVTWLLLATVFQQLLWLSVDVWAAVWLTVMADLRASAKDATAAASAGADASFLSRFKQRFYTWTAVEDTVFLGIISGLTVLAMLLTLLRARAVYIGVYGTVHFIYDQIVRRVVHAPASYFDSRIIALLSRVLQDDAAVAEYRVPGTAEQLLSCAAQVFFIAAWNSVVNPIFVLLLPTSVSLFYHIFQRHAVVLREVRKLEVGSVSAMADILREVYQGASTVRCMALQDRLREEYCRALDTVNTASMVAYLADRWVELRLHLLAALAVSAAAMLGVVFTFAYSPPSFIAVAIIVTLRAGPVLSMLCRNLGTFAVMEWLSVQRLMSLWSVPQEPLTLEGDADLYNYSHVRRNATGPYVELEGGQNAPLVNIVGTPVVSPATVAIANAPAREANSLSESHDQPATTVTSGAAEAAGKATTLGCPGKAGHEKGKPKQRPTKDGGTSASSPMTEQSSMSAFVAASSTSSSEALHPLVSATTTTTTTTMLERQEASVITLPQLELRNVSARYRTTLPYVLWHVNLAVYPRERLGVVGHAGQGKGSLFNVLLRLVDVIEGGGVFVDGENAARVPYPILRSWFALIPQEPLLVHGSWRTNLLMGYHPAHRLLIEGAKGQENRPYLPIATLPRQNLKQQQAQQQRGGGDYLAGAAPPHLTEASASASQLDLRTRDSNMACANESAGSLPASESYGSVDSAQAFMQNHGESRLRYIDSGDELPLSRDPSRGGSRKSGSGDNVNSLFARAARRIRDSLPSFRRRTTRSSSGGVNGSAGGGHRRGVTSTGTTATSNGGTNNSGNNSVHRRRRRASRSPGGFMGSGRPAEGPRQPVEDAALWAALRAVGLDAAAEFDGGLDAPLAGSDVSETDLTESQCRLLCLARAVLNKPPIVLLEDTVFSGAEAQTDQAIRRVLANELRDSTVIIIAHRMSTVLNLCTRVVAMREGSLLPIADLRCPVAQQQQQRLGDPAASVSVDSYEPSPSAVLSPEALRKLSYYVE